MTQRLLTQEKNSGAFIFGNLADETRESEHCSSKQNVMSAYDDNSNRDDDDDDNDDNEKNVSETNRQKHLEDKDKDAWLIFIKKDEIVACDRDTSNQEEIFTQDTNYGSEDNFLVINTQVNRSFRYLLKNVRN